MFRHQATRTIRLPLILTLLAAVFVMLPATPKPALAAAHAIPGTTERVSVRSGGNQRTGASGEAALAPAPSATSLIAYIETGGDAPGLYLVEPDGSNRQLIVPGNDLGDPRWSPDGTMIAFLQEYVDSYPTALEVVRLSDLSVSTLLPCVGHISGHIYGYHFSQDHSWSADSTMIAITSCTGLVVVDVATGASTTISSDPAAGYPSWHPFENALIFRCAGGLGGSVCTVNADGTDLQEITPFNNSTISAPPKWSPEGSSFLVTHTFVGDFLDVYDANGTDRQRVWPPLSMSYQFLFSIPAWSPAGSEIAFAGSGASSSRCGETTQIVDSSTGTLRSYSTGRPLHQPWSPDGSQLVVEWHDICGVVGGGIYVQQADGSGQTRIVDTPADEWGAAWCPVVPCGEPLPPPEPPSHKVVFVDGWMSEANCRPSDSGELRTYLKANSWLNARLPAPGLTDQNFVWFSYAGPPSDTNAYCGGGDLQKPNYSKADTCNSIDDAGPQSPGTARNLDALVDTLIAQDPQVVIDMIGYSQGGLIAAYWAATLAEPDQLDNVHSVVTYDSPLGGISDHVKAGAVWFCRGAGNFSLWGAAWDDMARGWLSVVPSAQSAPGKARFYTIRGNPGFGSGWCWVLCDIVAPDSAATFNGVACDTADDHRASTCGPGKNVVDLYEDMGTHPGLWSSPTAPAKELTACAILGWTCEGNSSLTLPPTIDSDTPIDLEPRVQDGAAVETFDVTTTYPSGTIDLPADCVISPSGSLYCPPSPGPQSRALASATSVSGTPQYSAGPGYSLWHIDNPEPGIWTHRLTNGGQSDLNVQVVTNRQYAPTPDADTDSIPDSVDNCPAATNADQTDTDADGLGDACDPDDDNDTWDDGLDNCPLVANSGQEDADGDGLGNACDGDNDNDGMQDAAEDGYACLDSTVDDSALDPDADSLANLVETLVGTDPCLPDSDDDNFDDGVELFVRTDPLAACPTVIGAHDAWPPDFNDDTRVNLSDVFLFRPHFATVDGAPGYDPRFDLNADGRVNLADVFVLRQYFASQCGP